MLTIFTTPKPFIGHDNVIQTNAIKSWTLLRPACEIILLGKDEGVAEVASELSIQHIPDIDCNEYGTPLVNDIFFKAQEIARHQILCYVNADIILMNDFLTSLKLVPKEPFLVVGQRWDIGLNEPINFEDKEWEQKLRQQLSAFGKLHSVSGIDYFVFSRGLYTDIPPFALGRTSWDNWLVYRARSLKAAVIDATKVITAIHQNHDYAHVSDGKTGAFKGPEARINQSLLGGWEYSFCPRHATWIFTQQGLKRAISIKHLLYQFDAIPVLFPRLRFLGIPKRTLIALSKAIRSALGKQLE